jgi:hypothetical protein
MTIPKIIQADVMDWAREYNGPKFHALLSDAPYHLASIVKRFGKVGSAPAQFGRDGAFTRASKGFMGETWDGGEISFKKETWQALCEHLLPGGFGMVFGSSRGWHRLAVAIEDAGMIIHPSVFVWTYSTGMPKATKVKVEGWEAFRYGGQALCPAAEPIIVFQKPYEGRPLDNIFNTGAGVLNIDKGREGESPAGRWPKNLILQHLRGCRVTGRIKRESYQINRWKDNAHPFGGGAGHEFETENREGGWVDVYACADGCPVQAMGDVQSGFYYQADWSYEVNDKLLDTDAVIYASKANGAERTAGMDEKAPHPTVKPIKLTKYLAGLMLPRADFAPRRIMVPFAGVMSEAIGADLAGWDEIVAIEKEPEYIPVAQARVDFWHSWVAVGETGVDVIIKKKKSRGKKRADQPELFGETV